MARLEKPYADMTGGNFRADMLARIKWPEHGYTSQIQHLKLIKHDDGNVVALNRNEWIKLLKPLLVKTKGQWYMAGYPVEVVEVAEDTRLHMAMKNRARSQAKTAARRSNGAGRTDS